jgi:hypothetical protein
MAIKLTEEQSQRINRSFAAFQEKLSVDHKIKPGEIPSADPQEFKKFRKSLITSPDALAKFEKRVAASLTASAREK